MECFLQRCKIFNIDYQNNIYNLFLFMEEKKNAADYYLQLISERRQQLESNPENAEWRHRTLLKHVTAQKLFREFASDACLDEIDKVWMGRLEKHLVGKGFSNSYVRKLLRDIKAFLNWACRTGLPVNTDFRNYRQKYKDDTARIINGNKFALSLEELNTLLSLDLHRRLKLQRTRDMFVFCCYTGLRFSDAMKLKWSDVGINTINVITKKTNQCIEIPITRQMRAILERYCGTYSETVFPKTTNTCYNTQLQAVGRMAGLDEDWIKLRQCGNKTTTVHLKKYQCLSSHVARRTFSTIALQQGIPTEVIMSITGHTTPRILQSYMKINPNMKRSYMERFAMDTDVETLARQIMQLPEDDIARLFTLILSGRRRFK